VFQVASRQFSRGGVGCSPALARPVSEPPMLTPGLLLVFALLVLLLMGRGVRR
jgi:hypothetical protein